MRSQRAPTALAFHSKSTTTGRLTPSARIRSRKVDLGIDRAFAAVPTFKSCSSVSRRGYDSFGNLAADTAPGTRVTLYGHDGYGRVNSITPPDGATQTIYYDLFSQPDSIRDGVNSQAIRYAPATAYDSITDPANQGYRSEFNAVGWVTKERDPVGRSDEYQYSLDGLVRAWKNRRGNTLATTYDQAFRPLSIGSDNSSTPRPAGWSRIPTARRPTRRT